MGVEKLTSQKSAEIRTRQDALQTTLAARVDIFYPRNFGFFEKNGLFQYPEEISLTLPPSGNVDVL